MNEQDVIDLINQWIVENHNNEITANVLNPVLLAMIQQPNLLIGDLGDLSTGENDNLVDAINWILSQISSGGITIHTGNNNPNETPPASYAVADFYSQLDVVNNPLYLWQYTGTEWARVTNYIDDSIEALDTTWSSHKISETIKGDRLEGNPTIILDENEITISGLSWWIQGTPYILIPEFIDTIPYASASGYSRKDIVVAVQSNNLVRIQGVEGDGIVQPPQVPENTLLVTEFDVFHDSVGEPTEPISGSNYIPKASEGWFTYMLNSANPEAIPTLSTQFNINFFAFASGHIIPGLNITSTASKIWNGGMIAIRNNSNYPITLKHLGSSGKIRFDFSNTKEDFVLTNDNGVKFFKLGVIPSTGNAIAYCLNDFVSGGGPTSADQVSYDNTASGLLAETVQEAVDELSGHITQLHETKEDRVSVIPISTNTTISALHHGKILLVTADVTITFPTGLGAGFTGCAFRIATGGKMTPAFASGVTSNGFFADYNPGESLYVFKESDSTNIFYAV